MLTDFYLSLLSMYAQLHIRKEEFFVVFIVKIFVEAVLDKWRQLMSVMSESGGRN